MRCRITGLVRALCAFVLVSAGASAAEAHPAIGAPSAYPTTPATVGIVASSTFTITWLDYDRPIPTGTATIDWFYVHENPKTYLIGAVPEDLAGDPIVAGLAESDPTNAYTWDLSSVPSGSYFIWSVITEPPGEPVNLVLYSYSQGVLTVHHPGDPVHPAVCFNKPDNPFVLVDEQLELVLETFDPDGTGLLTLELFSRDSPEVLVPIFVDRPAAGRIDDPLDTSELAEGDYGLRFSIIDGRGLSFAAHTRWFFRVSHNFAPEDAGLPGDLGTGADAGGSSDGGHALDAGAADSGDGAGDDEGCRCVSSAEPTTPWSWFVLLFLGLGRRRSRRRRISDAPPSPVG